MRDFGVKDQSAFSPQGALVGEAVAAIPSTGGAVASLLAVGVGVVVAAVLDVARTENCGGVRRGEQRKRESHQNLLNSFLFCSSNDDCFQCDYNNVIHIMIITVPLLRRLCFTQCLSVCLSARSRKRLQADLAEIFRVGWIWSKEEVPRFWC